MAPQILSRISSNIAGSIPTGSFPPSVTRSCRTHSKRARPFRRIPLPTSSLAQRISSLVTNALSANTWGIRRGVK